MVCAELLPFLRSGLFAWTVVHSGPNGESVCGVGEVVGRISVGRGGQNTEKYPARLPLGCPLVTIVARARLTDSGGSTVSMSGGCSRGVAGGAKVAQLLDLGSPSSPFSWHLGSLFLVIGV